MKKASSLKNTTESEIEDTGFEKMPPALTPEGRENQMISLATRLAEKQLREGTASSQVITHYLKLGTIKAKQELLLLQKQTELAEAKAQSLQTAKRVEELYANALNAMRRYSGYHQEDVDDEDLY